MLLVGTQSPGSSSLAPSDGERVGVRGSLVERTNLLTPALSSIRWRRGRRYQQHQDARQDGGGALQIFSHSLFPAPVPHRNNLGGAAGTGRARPRDSTEAIRQESLWWDPVSCIQISPNGSRHSNRNLRVGRGAKPEDGTRQGPASAGRADAAGPCAGRGAVARPPGARHPQGSRPPLRSARRHFNGPCHEPGRRGTLPRLRHAFRSSAASRGSYRPFPAAAAGHFCGGRCEGGFSLSHSNRGFAKSGSADRLEVILPPISRPGSQGHPAGAFAHSRPGPVQRQHAQGLGGSPLALARQPPSGETRADENLQEPLVK